MWLSSLFIAFIAIIDFIVHCINCMYVSIIRHLTSFILKFTESLHLVLTFNITCTFEYMSRGFHICVNMYVQEYMVIT